MAALRLAMTVDANNPDVGDIYIGIDGTDRLCTSLLEEVQQYLFTIFRFFLGEWFLDTTVGMPWFQSILGQKIPLSVVAQLFRSIIIGAPGVASLETFSLTVDAQRAARCVFACKLKDGTVLRSSDFPPFVVGTLTIGGP